MIRFRGPAITDARLHVASVLLTVQVLGQVVVGFDLSIAQILVSLFTAAAVETAITAPRDRIVAWPASAMLTGNGVALILRVPGTEHGDWWSLRGWYVFAAVAAVSVLSKYVIRWDDRPLFNPSNLGLVMAFLIVGSGVADPQDLWWGAMSPGLVVVYAVIVAGGLVITRRLDLLRISAAFMATYAVVVGASTLAGHSMVARWSLGAVSGWTYWSTVVLSPEVMIFLFFMITDPRTIARGRRAGTLFGVLVGLTCGVLVSFQSTEYATKVALLSGLVVVCAARPLIEARAHVRNSGPALAGLAAVGLAVIGGATNTAADRGTVEPDDQMVAAVAELALTDDQYPSVTIGEGFASIGGSFSPADGERVANDVVRAVLLSDLAVETGDDELARAAATGPYLRTLEATPRHPAPERTFDSARLDIVRNPLDFQAQPRLSVELTGTEAGAPWAATYHVVATTADARIEIDATRDDA